MDAGAAGPSQPTRQSQAALPFASAKWIHEVPADQLGIKVLVEPNENVDVDIVAVHGLGAIPALTWREKKSGTVWLADKHMLPKILPTARIMMFGYDSIYVGEKPVRTSIQETANLLLAELEAYRKHAPDRPLLFIGHCFGGLVIEKAILFSKLRPDPKIIQATAGIVFLGTPHRGTETFSDQGELMSTIAEAIAASDNNDKIRMEPAVLQALRSMHGNLVEGSDDFARLCIDTRIPICCFLEKRSSDVGKLVGRVDIKEFVVDAASASLDGQPALPLSVDHFALNKFANPDDGNYKAVCHQLERMYEQGLERNHAEMARRRSEPSSTVPFPRDPDFVDRGDILTEVHAGCLVPAGRVALVGLGGVGSMPKTWVFWVHASNAARFKESYQAIADRLELPGRDDPKNILRLVCAWLRHQTNFRWTMILDNADSCEVVYGKGEQGQSTEGESSSQRVTPLIAYLPQVDHGSILITSRNKDLAFRLTGNQRNIIPVDPMEHDDALNLLKKKLQSTFEEEGAALVKMLDYMPLAISQAAAYINHRAPRMSIQKYIETFRKSEKSQTKLLLEDMGELRRDERSALNSIITTWQISFDQIRSERVSAADLLSLMSLFDRQGIPEYLLREKDWISNDEDSNSGTEDDFEDDVDMLRRYFLINVQADGESFEMHRLVQLSTRTWLEVHGQLEKWRQNYAKLLSKSFPIGKFENWPKCKVLFPHAQAMLIQRPSLTALLDWASVLINASWYAKEIGNYSTAEDMARKGMLEREKALGKEHPDTLTSVNNLASVLWNQGKFEEAEEMNRRALAGFEKISGKEHPDTLASVNNLASMLLNQGNFEEAEHMNRRALAGFEKIFGKEHPDTLMSVNNLAGILWKQGKFEEAEQMNRRTLEGQEKILGKEHPDTLMSVSNVALVLWKQGRFEEAEEMYRRTLERREKILGKEHPDTLRSLDNLASTLWEQRKFEEAEEMKRRALEGQEKVLGKEHPETVKTVLSLAIMLHEHGNLESAASLYQRAIHGFTQTLGAEHPTIIALKNKYLALLEKLDQR